MRTFSERSLKELTGVDARLVAVVSIALLESELDFAVVDGIRTKEEQEALVKAGASKTMYSMHLEGKAVDLAPYVNGKIRWELPAVCKVARGMQKASSQLGITLRWGGAWDRHLNGLSGRLEHEIEDYIKRQKELNRAAFIDAVHFELTHDYD